MCVLELHTFSFILLSQIYKVAFDNEEIGH